MVQQRPRFGVEDRHVASRAVAREVPRDGDQLRHRLVANIVRHERTRQRRCRQRLLRRVERAAGGRRGREAAGAVVGLNAPYRGGGEETSHCACAGGGGLRRRWRGGARRVSAAQHIVKLLASRRIGCVGRGGKGGNFGRGAALATTNPRRSRNNSRHTSIRGSADATVAASLVAVAGRCRHRKRRPRAVPEAAVRDAAAVVPVEHLFAPIDAKA